MINLAQRSTDCRSFPGNHNARKITVERSASRIEFKIQSGKSIIRLCFPPPCLLPFALCIKMNLSQLLALICSRQRIGPKTPWPKWIWVLLRGSTSSPKWCSSRHPSMSPNAKLAGIVDTYAAHLEDKWLGKAKSCSLHNQTLDSNPFCVLISHKPCTNCSSEGADSS